MCLFFFALSECLLLRSHGIRLKIITTVCARLNTLVGQARLNTLVGQARLNTLVGQVLILMLISSAYIMTF
jgi:hypothetical protein